jgi:hypothetical protein
VSRADIDPDVLQAIEDLRDDFADYRRCSRQMKELSPVTDFLKFNAARDFRGDKLSIIRTRAERIGIDPDALVILLGASHDARQRLKKRPSRHQMAVAVRTAAATTKDRLAAAKVAADAAATELASAARADVAARAACVAYTGYIPS